MKRLSDAATAPNSVSRLLPPRVIPAIVDGIRYAAIIGDADGIHAQAGGLLAAYRSDGKLLWSMKVYDNRRRDDLEGDVQDVFFQVDGRAAGRQADDRERGRPSIPGRCERALLDAGAERSTR